MFKIESNFIWIFKVGDNINYNLKILEQLYNYESTLLDEDKVYLYKPMIIIIASICEAILYDFHFRIKHNNTKEVIQNIDSATIENIKNKNIDKFDTYIASAKKNELFAKRDSNLYVELDNLRKLRNRVHIQNEKKHFDPNEKCTFTVEKKINAEKTLEMILKKMRMKYYRPQKMSGYVNNFFIPWEEYFPNFE